MAKLNIIVVGGGLFGLAAALELTARGHGVRVLETGTVPRPEASSTDISKAVRMDYGADALYTALAEAAIDGWHTWNRRWPAPRYHQSGFLILAGEPMQPGGFEHDSFAALTARGHPLERLDPRRLKERFPAWRAERYPDGYFNPTAGWVESGAVVTQLAAEARAAGIQIYERTAVERVLERDDGVAGLVTAGGRQLPADRVLVAAGAWTPALVPGLGEWMRPVAQPIFHLRPPAPERFRLPGFTTWAADIARTGWYGFPATTDGTLKIASHGPGRLLDPDGPRTVPAAETARLRRFLADALPVLADTPVHSSRLCFYCDTADGDFLIDAHPELCGLVVAAGGSGHAFKFGPVIGPVIADAVEGKANPYCDRFRWRRPATQRAEAARHLEQS